MPSNVPVARHVRVTGRVQGVFFRQWTADQARELGVSGWVRNRPDGTVEARLSGEEQAVSQLVDRMRRGPPSAHVTHIWIDRLPPEEGQGFEVRRG